jgi:mannose-6-phosphate isomerase-like protein (cupin superfamily)
MNKVNLREKLGQVTELWSPKIVGQVADVHVKIVKVEGEFPWHLHEHEDELFLVVHGSIVLEFRDRRVPLDEGEFLIVPKGVEHRPVAAQEAHIVLIEPAGTLNTGNVRTEHTVDHPDWL